MQTEVCIIEILVGLPYLGYPAGRCLLSSHCMLMEGVLLLVQLTTMIVLTIPEARPKASSQTNQVFQSFMHEASEDILSFHLVGVGHGLQQSVRAWQLRGQMPHVCSLASGMASLFAGVSTSGVAIIARMVLQFILSWFPASKRATLIFQVFSSLQQVLSSRQVTPILFSPDQWQMLPVSPEEMLFLPPPMQLGVSPQDTCGLQHLTVPAKTYAAVQDVR